MTYHETMQHCTDYIHEHLSEPLTPELLAGICGYSYSHFCHVFKIFYGISPGEFIRRERLTSAAGEIAGGKKITDAAFDYGFQTLSGFTRAFTRTYGMNPSNYQKQNGALSPSDQKKEDHNMTFDVYFKDMDAIAIAAYCFSPREGETVDVKENGAYWLGKDFSAVSSERYAQLADGRDEIGLWYHPDSSGSLSYLFGTIIKDGDEIPAGLTTFTIPAAHYAVFTTKPVNLKDNPQKFAASIQDCWRFIYEKWMDESGYQYDPSGLSYEFYSAANGCLDSDNAVMNIFVPVVKK